MAAYLKDVVTLILAGGEGRRLGPLTRNRSKPSVPFGGKYRIIDFMMSNCLNSGLTNILVLTQYRSHELNKHLRLSWPSNIMHGFSVEPVPAQQIHGEEWYRGTADAVYQNLSIIGSEGDFTTAAILSGDHILAMQLRQMYEFHKNNGSVFTVCAMSIPAQEAHRFGVIEVDADGRIIGFEEKPEHPKEAPGKPGMSYISLGNYFAELEYLSEILEEDNGSPETDHDFGKDIIPKMIDDGMPVFAYDFLDNHVPGQVEHYWRDVGTIQAFFDANMDLAAMKPELNLYNDLWQFRTPEDNLPPAKINSLTMKNGTCSEHWIASGGCIIEDTFLRKAVLGRKVRVYGASIEESIIFSGVKVGHRSVLHRVIVDEDVIIPPGTTIGINHKADKARGLYIDKESGIVVVPKGFVS
jgi:glucose-1-phosphate adenylyltransferase